MAQIKINNIIYGSNNSADIIYKDTTVEEKLNSIPVFDPSDNANIEANQYDYLTYGNIYDGLNSSDTSKALSANQGKLLNEKIDSVEMTNNENITALDNKITNNINDISNIKGSISDINTNISNNRSLIDSHTNSINTLNNNFSSLWKPTILQGRVYGNSITMSVGPIDTLWIFSYNIISTINDTIGGGVIGIANAWHTSEIFNMHHNSASCSSSNVNNGNITFTVHNADSSRQIAYFDYRIICI